MAQFRATIKGNRGEASRLGTKKSGLVARINGWDIGVAIYARHEKGHDYLDVYQTSGSNGGYSDLLIASISEYKPTN